MLQPVNSNLASSLPWGKPPLLCLVRYDPDTWEGYAYIVEDGVEKKAPVTFDPFRLVWTRKIVLDSENSAD